LKSLSEARAESKKRKEANNAQQMPNLKKIDPSIKTTHTQVLKINLPLGKDKGVMDSILNKTKRRSIYDQHRSDQHRSETEEN
jgi:hypothetical protein